MPDLKDQDIVSLAAGSLNSAAIARDGSCFTWGSGKVTALAGASCFVSRQDARRAAALMRNCLPNPSTYWQLPKVHPDAALHTLMPDPLPNPSHPLAAAEDLRVLHHMQLCVRVSPVEQGGKLGHGSSTNVHSATRCAAAGLSTDRSHCRPASTKRNLVAWQFGASGNCRMHSDLELSIVGAVPDGLCRCCSNRSCRVESFVGRTQIGRVALGLDHSLFLDHDGSTWACGENKEASSSPLST